MIDKKFTNGDKEMKTKLTFLLSFTFLFFFSGSVYGEEPETEDKTCFQVYPNKMHPNKETIISKDDADCIFSITMDKWNTDVIKMFNPLGGTARVMPFDSGNSIMTFDEKSQTGLMVQPIFQNKTKPPIMLFVNTYYPEGLLPELTNEVKKTIENASRNDLGKDYSITFSYKGMPPLKGIEMIITNNKSGK
jgi:hypothetical protein